MDEHRDGAVQAMDFIEFISQDLPWDDIDRALGDKPEQVRPEVTCSPAEQEFHADDLSLFSAFASSLPCLGPQADCDTDIKAIRSSIGRIEGDAAGIGTDLAQDMMTDLDCPDGVGLSSEMEDIMADILDGSVGEGLARSYGENEQVYDESRDDSSLQSDNNDATHVVESRFTCNMNSGDKNVAALRRGETVSDISSLSEQSTAGGEAECGNVSNLSDNGRQDSNDDNDDDDDMTASQRWVRDQLQTHLAQQHAEASRINSLRDLLPPDTSSVPRDRVGRAEHIFTTEVEVIKLDTQLTGALLASNPDASRCCRLLDDYSPYELSPRVLVQYPFFAGTVDVCCRWAGDQADQLRHSAHRLRAFMMALYARDSVDEGFLTALNRQV